MIETRRLRLRTLKSVDVTQAYVDWLNDTEVNRFLEIRHGPKQTLQSVQEFVEDCSTDPETMLFGAFAKDSGAHIGNIKLGPINRIYGTADLGLLIGPAEVRGQGLGQEMIQATTRYAFDELGLRKVTAGCYEAHLASLRGFLKSGFVVEGFRPQEVLFEGAPHGVFLLGRLRPDQHD